MVALEECGDNLLHINIVKNTKDAEHFDIQEKLILCFHLAVELPCLLDFPLGGSKAIPLDH